MKIFRAYKVELDPNNEQRTALLRHCGAARWVYNWGLSKKIEAFKSGGKIPKSFALAKELRSVRTDVAPWLNEHSTYCIDSILPRCDDAFESFFQRCKAGIKGKKGLPRFRSRKQGIGSMSFHKAYFVEQKRIRLPKIGWIQFKEYGYAPTTDNPGIKFYSATVKENNGRWFVVIQVELEVSDKVASPNTPCIGVDFGIKSMATLSSGRVVNAPNPLKKSSKKLRRVQRSFSRKIEAAKRDKRPLQECKNFQKNKLQLAKIHARVANIRKNALHNLSHDLTKTKSGVCIEDLNVAGMMKNHSLARAISDIGFWELRRQIEYKAAWRGVRVVVADRWFPSSKTCGACGLVNADLKLSQRTWMCACGAKHDRDLNAAKNLAAYAQKLAGTVSDNSNACGEGSSSLKVSALLPVPFVEAGTEQFALFAWALASEPSRKRRGLKSRSSLSRSGDMNLALWD